MDIPIVEAEPGKTFVTAGDDGPDGMPYLMEITISKDGGDTVMHLVNSGFSEDPKKDDNFRGTVSGWANALTTMKVWLEQLSDAHPASRSRREARSPTLPSNCGRSTRRSRAAPSGCRLTCAHTGEVLCDRGPEILLS